MRQPSFEKTQHSQRISRAAVPSKRSSPPAEKCGVCIGATPLSQAEMAGKSRVRALRDPNTASSWHLDMNLLRSDACLLDNAQVFRTLAVHKFLELHDRHGRDNRPSRFQARLHIRLHDHP